MNTAIQTDPLNQLRRDGSKPLWAAVAVLGAAVLAMGGTMLYQGGRSATGSPSLPATAVAQLSTSPTRDLSKPAGMASAGGYGVVPIDDGVEKPRAQPAAPEPVPAPVKKVVKPKPQPKPSSAPNMSGVAPAAAVVLAPAPSVIAAPVAAVAVPICNNCGAVESVTPFERTTKADGPGVGAVAGGVAGAVLGSQVGRGNGRTAAAILGAIGGGFAGNAIENNIKKETVYRVGVRMDDGSRRTVELAQAPATGGKVTIEAGGIRSTDGVVYRNVAELPQRASTSAPAYQTP